MSMPRYSPVTNILCILYNMAGHIPAPYTTRFVVRSGELLNSKYGRSAIGAERHILIAGATIRAGYGAARTVEELFLNEWCESRLNIPVDWGPWIRCSGDDKSPLANISRWSLMIEDHTNGYLFRIRKVRAPLADSIILSGVAFVQFSLVYLEADKSTVLVDHAKQCP